MPGIPVQFRMPGVYVIKKFQQRKTDFQLLGEALGIIRCVLEIVAAILKAYRD